MHQILENIANAIKYKVEQDLVNDAINEDTIGLFDGASGILLFYIDIPTTLQI